VGRVRKAQLAPPARRAAGGRRSHRAVCGALRPLRPRDLLTRRVQLVRRDGRDVSTLYGRGGGTTSCRLYEPSSWCLHVDCRGSGYKTVQDGTVL